MAELSNPPPEPIRSPLVPARWSLVLIQLLFLLTAVWGLDGHFLSAHNERQNQTFDTARHVFRNGWRSVVAPEVAFSLRGYPDRTSTAIKFEVPFHGLLGWPIAAVFHHEEAAVRIVSLCFALISIQFIHGIVRMWFGLRAALIGAALWAFAPLVLHFGQVPMPDILCTAGMLGAFYCALRGNGVASSGFFLFSLLAKANVIVFGLPILGALLIQKNVRTLRDVARVSCAWGVIPLVGFAGWILTTQWSSASSPWTISFFYPKVDRLSNLTEATFWAQAIGCVIPFGLGLVGSIGLACGLRCLSAVDKRLKWAIVASAFFYLVLVLGRVAEPQYFLPPLAWAVILAAPGLEILARRLFSCLSGRIVFGAGLVAHAILAFVLTVDLKSSRIPDFPSIQKAASLLPAESRVLVAYSFYGASPAVWFDRNVYVIRNLDELKQNLPELKRLGFTHLCILETESRHTRKPQAFPRQLANLWKRALGSGETTNSKASLAASVPAGVREYCDEQLPILLETPHVRLYAIPPSLTEL